MSNRKKETTPEQREDAARLRELFLARAGMSQEKFGEEYELGTQGLVHQYLKGLIPLNLEAAIKFADGLRCNVSDFSPKLAELLARGRKNDSRLERYEIPDHMLHQVLGDFQRLSEAVRQEFLKRLRAAVITDRELAARGVQTNYPDDQQVRKALQIDPSRLKPEQHPGKLTRKQLSLFSRRGRKPEL